METFWLCDDCLLAEAYGDFTALSFSLPEHEVDQCIQQIESALKELMPFSADFDSESGWGIDEFSRSPCGCCNSLSHGRRHRFVRL
ncbi:hypothetical protein [Pseudomonas sp. LRF_L74]|uniref:hypothetical protein n=1 Tax=Pseudomonas sp. LRF_L74 TaxID=3369422 RepID=UPI003F5EDA18